MKKVCGMVKPKKKRAAIDQKLGTAIQKMLAQVFYIEYLAECAIIPTISGCPSLKENNLYSN